MKKVLLTAQLKLEMSLWSFFSYTSSVDKAPVGPDCRHFSHSKREINRLVYANDMSNSHALWLQRKLYCLHYCQKEVPNTNYVKTQIVVLDRYSEVLSWSSLSLVFTYLENGWGTAHLGRSLECRCLPAEVSTRTTGGLVDGWLVTLLH